MKNQWTWGTNSYEKIAMSFKCRRAQHQRRYQYKGFWIDISLIPNFENHEFSYQVCIELPNQAGIISDYSYPSLDEAEFAAEELIDSWN